MKKNVISVIVVCCLILVVGAVGILTSLVKKHTPSKERMDAKEYFQVESEEEAALVVNRQLTEEKVKRIDGRCYVEDTIVGTYINSRFYWDEQNQVMLYSMPTEILQIMPETKEYQVSGEMTTVDYVILRSMDGTFYMDLEFVNQFSPMSYKVYEEPARVVLETGIQEISTVCVKEDSVIRRKGGIKSPILCDVKKGEILYLEESMENWSRVSTEDGYTGYIENDCMENVETVLLDHSRELPEYTSIHRDFKINLTWHQVTSVSANDSLAQVLEGTEGLNVISPTWFSVTDNDGTISSLASASYVETAHAAGLEVWGLIDNFNANVDTLTLLSDTKVRTFLIEQLMAEAERVNLDGINLDFESITQAQAPHYVQFIRELSVACRQNGLVFSIDNPVPMSYNQYYDLEEQGIVADYVIIMAYDEHYAGSSEAGSVSSLNFVNNGICAAMESVPKEKLINGIPFYTRLWIETFGGGITSEVLGMNGTSNYIEQNGMDTYWDKVSGQTVATLEGDDALYTIWVEDELSIAEKMKLIREYDLAGVASWKLGLERDSVWSVIAEYLK